MREAICDTSPIQYLHQIGLLDLLGKFYSEVVGPPAVVAELDRSREIGIDLPDIRELPWMKLRSAGPTTISLPMADLGAGEREVLALGIQFPETLLILDERLAREHAQALHLTFTGTLGILLRAKAEGHVVNIELFLERLTLRGFRLSAKTHAAVLRLAGE